MSVDAERKALARLSQTYRRLASPATTRAAEAELAGGDEKPPERPEPGQGKGRPAAGPSR